VKDGGGRIYSEGTIPATRSDLDEWVKGLPRPWTARWKRPCLPAASTIICSPQAAALKVAHPLMLHAIAAAKKKNDRIDANKVADWLRCDFLRQCYMASMEILVVSWNGPLSENTVY
jgi:hypothetical protein